MLSRTVVAVLALFSIGASFQACAQQSALEAELTEALVADTLAHDASFMMKVTAPWQDGRCRLVPGEVLHATVGKSEHNAKGKVTSISFEVKAPCADEKPLPLVVTSLLAPVEVEQLSGQFFRKSTFGQSTGVGSAGINMTQQDMSGQQNAALPLSNGPVVRGDRPTSVHVGEVYHLSRVRLTVPAPGTTESTISTTASSLKLPARTTFVLQGSRLEGQPRFVRTGGSTTASTVTRPVRHSLIKACVAGRCTRQSPAMAASFGAVARGSGIDLGSFGFRGERDREMKDLDTGSAVQFLADDEVLVTFPSHQLVRRINGHLEVHARSVRALTMDAATFSLRSKRDWEIPDSNTYVWSLGDKILVHTGQNLHLYGPTLQEIASYQLETPLAGLRVSPDGKHILVGTLHELHTPEEHQALLQADARGPEEEVNWNVLGSDLVKQRTVGTSSTLRLPPVLLDDGMVELRKEGNDKWHFVRYSWDSAAESQLGTFDSSCMPTVESTRPDLLVLSTCDTTDLGAHSFLLHEDGTPVLDEALDWHDFLMSSVSGSQEHRLAYMVARGKDEYTRGGALHVNTLRSEAAEVMDAQTGASLASVPFPAVSPYKQSVALSPDGRKLAMLAGSRLWVYDLEH